jgi:hypothetical protein
MLEQKAGITPTDETVPLLVEKEVDALPPMPEIVYATETTPKDEPVVGSALKQGPGLPLVKRKRKKKQVKHSNTRDLFLKLTLI